MNIAKLRNLIDCRVAFAIPDGNFEGVLKVIFSERVTFEHVFLLPSRKYMGTMHILLDEITSFELVVTADKILDVKWDLSKQLQFQHLQEKFPADYCVVNSKPKFYRAINVLSGLRSVGVSFHGPDISRYGNLSWVCLSSPSCVFMFDIEQLGKKAFSGGLKGIFEDEKIEKVIHDCREAADCLLHNFQTKLKNVFDTQVADYVINMQMYTGKGMFKYVNALDSCLVAYLKVPQQFLYNRNRCLSLDDEIKFFQIRPVSDEFRNVLVKSAMYLVVLKEVQEKLLLQPFEDAVEVYLNVLRTATDSKVYREPTEFTQSAPACLSRNTKRIRFSDSESS